MKKFTTAFVIPYNPIDESSGLQNACVRIAKAISEKFDYKIKILSPGKSGIKSDVYINGYKSFYHILGNLLFDRDIKVIYWMEIFPNGYTKYFQYTFSVLLRLLGKHNVLGIGTYGNMINRGGGKLGYWLAKSAFEAFIVLNRKQVRELISCGMNRSRVYHLSRGVDPSIFSVSKGNEKTRLRDKYSLPRDKTIILYLGRFVARKRPGLLIKLFTESTKLHKDAILLLVGSSYNHEDSVDELIKKMIPKDAPIVKLESIEETWEVYKLSDIFITLSEREGESNSVLEAMSCGLPILSFDVPGISSIVKDNINGYTIDNNDLLEMKNKLSNLVFDSSLRHCMSKMSREIILKERHIIDVSREYLNLFKILQHD